MFALKLKEQKCCIMSTHTESEGQALFRFQHTPLRLFSGVLTSALRTAIVTSEMANALKAAGMKEANKKERATVNRKSFC